MRCYDLIVRLENKRLGCWKNCVPRHVEIVPMLIVEDFGSNMQTDVNYRVREIKLNGPSLYTKRLRTCPKNISI